MKERLNKQLGPFKIWQWLVIIIAGVGLGLLVRRRFTADTPHAIPDHSGTAMGSNPDAGGVGGGMYSEGAPHVSTSPDFETIRGVVDEQDRLRDELERGFEDLGDSIEDLFTRLRDRETPINLPREPGEPVPLPMPRVPRPTPDSPTTPPAPNYKTYTVQRGDSLWKIARQFGVKDSSGKVHWSPIYDLNRSVIGPNPDLIRPGQQLKIPA